jgi:predicted RND superfamily exporter protein
MLAIMRLAGVDLNFANMIVMPLIVGIGVGSGVHVVRRWRLQPRDEPHGLAGGSGRAITLTTLTTVAGFASMMLAQHRGIRSLGFTMTVGLMMVWLVTIVALPAILRLRAGAASR